MSGNDMWVLHYPTGFLSKLAVTCLKNLEEWLKAEDLDPYAYYKVGEFMLEEFFDFEETVNAALVADVWRHH